MAVADWPEHALTRVRASTWRRAYPVLFPVLARYTPLATLDARGNLSVGLFSRTRADGARMLWRRVHGARLGAEIAIPSERLVTVIVAAGTPRT
jgi:hypothetical protein